MGHYSPELQGVAHYHVPLLKLARTLLIETRMTNGMDTQLHSWLNAVSRQLQVRRVENQARPRPKRNRERERARREARQLFARWYADRAVVTH